MLTSSSEEDLLSAVTAFTLKRHLKGFYWESKPCVASYPQTRTVTDARGTSSPVVRTSGEGAGSRGRLPGHHAQLAAEGVGVLGGAQQLCAAPGVGAVLGHRAPKFNERLPVGSDLPGAGDELVLALEQKEN